MQNKLKILGFILISFLVILNSFKAAHALSYICLEGYANLDSLTIYSDGDLVFEWLEPEVQGNIRDFGQITSFGTSVTGSTDGGYAHVWAYDQQIGVSSYHFSNSGIVNDIDQFAINYRLPFHVISGAGNISVSIDIHKELEVYTDSVGDVASNGAFASFMGGGELGYDGNYHQSVEALDGEHNKWVYDESWNITGFFDEPLYSHFSLIFNNDGIYINDAVVPTPVPEPTSMLLLTAGLAGIAVFRNKFKLLAPFSRVLSFLKGYCATGPNPV